MMIVRRRRYYLYTERESHTISSKWKVLHTSVFILLALNSFLSTYTFESALKNLNHRCFLYATPVLRLRPVEPHTTTMTDVTENTQNITKYPPNLKNTYDGFGKKHVRNVHNTNDEDPYSTYTTETTDIEYTADIENVTSFPPDRIIHSHNETEIQIRDNKYWFSNSTFSGEVFIDTRRTKFSSPVMCGLVIFNSMTSNITATFFAVLMILCGKGGREMDVMKQPWLFVYPILIITSLMVIISIVTASKVVSGFRTFCSGFEQFTGKSSCSYLMDYFFFQKEPQRRNFYGMYKICVFSFYAGIILWTAQLSLILLRIIYVADFQLNMIVVERRKRSIAEDDNEEVVRGILEQIIPGIVENKVSEIFENEEQQREDTTQV